MKKKELLALQKQVFKKVKDFLTPQLHLEILLALSMLDTAKLNLKIADVPIRYRERTYGTTNIQRWSHGWLLLRMVLFAARKLKFV